MRDDMSHPGAVNPDEPPHWDDSPLPQYQESPEDHWYPGDADWADPPPMGSTDPRDTGHDLNIVATLRLVLAAHHQKPFSALRDQINQIMAAEAVLAQLDKPAAKTYTAVIELLLDLAINCDGGTVDLFNVPTVKLYDRSVQTEIDTIASLTKTSELPASPATTWFALSEAVQRAEAIRTSETYLTSLKRKEPVAELVKQFKVIQPPTTKKADVRHKAAKSAAEVMAAHHKELAAAPQIRLSSGYRTLDMALSRKGEPIGFIAPGEGIVVAGPTGTGKSSWTYGVVPAMCQDLINWGYPDAKIIFAHTEEESIHKIKSMDIVEGGAFQHLADNLIVAAIGTSRAMLAQTIYDCVREAQLQHLQTGRPITQFLPYALILDYIQSLSEQGESEVVATAQTAEFVLRGVQAWNPDEMAKFSGVSYSEYTGSSWPEGMESHRVAGIYMAQLVKQDDSSLFYKPGDRKSQLSDFALEDTADTPAWVGTDGNGYGWEVKENDLRLLKQNAIRGSGVILQNATTILILHRSRPYNNQKLPDIGADGRYHLEDRRGRFLLDKTRNGSAVKFVPMAFDLDYKAYSARYIDVAAEEALNRGLFKIDRKSFIRSGDPLLPIRVQQSPLSSHRY